MLKGEVIDHSILSFPESTTVADASVAAVVDSRGPKAISVSDSVNIKTSLLVGGDFSGLSESSEEQTTCTVKWLGFIEAAKSSSTTGGVGELNSSDEASDDDDTLVSFSLPITKEAEYEARSS